MRLKFIFTICTSLVCLAGCYSNESQAKNELVQTQTTIKLEDICKSKKISNTSTKYIGWEFKPLDKSKLRKCEKVNLVKYKNLSCSYEDNLVGNNKPGINLSKKNDNEGWYRFIYSSKSICQDSLEIYNANAE